MIYIITSDVKTGGPELLHQFAYYANKLRPGSAKIFYVGEKSLDNNFDFFKKYICKEDICESIIDEVGNYIIVPETMTSYLRLYKNAEKIVWWLSVDNYFLNYGAAVNSVKGKALMLLRKLKRRYYSNNNALTISELLSINHHWFQSQYAKDTLTQYNISGKMLGDYLESGIINGDKTSNKRQNVILYNPKKGFGETKKIIDYFNNNCKSEYKFVPLVGYNRDQLNSLFLESKIYIDFGYHPGKDRMPREAVANGCVVITNTQGSAANSVDIPIDNQYKIDKIDGENLEKTLILILDIFKNFEKHSSNFKMYLESIRSEEANFKKDLEFIICESNFK